LGPLTSTTGLPFLAFPPEEAASLPAILPDLPFALLGGPRWLILAFDEVLAVLATEGAALEPRDGPGNLQKTNQLKNHPYCYQSIARTNLNDCVTKINQSTDRLSWGGVHILGSFPVTAGAFKEDEFLGVNRRPPGTPNKSDSIESSVCSEEEKQFLILEFAKD
jgi:hypothetical protein